MAVTIIISVDSVVQDAPVHRAMVLSVKLDYLVVANVDYLRGVVFVHYALILRSIHAQKVEVPFLIGEGDHNEGIIVKLVFLTPIYNKASVFNIAVPALIGVVVQMPSPINVQIITLLGNAHYAENVPCKIKTLAV